MLKIIIIKILYFLTKKILSKYKPRIIGITGSVGKTSAKQAIAAVLATKFSLRSSPKSYNTEIGVPLTVIGIDTSPERSVLGWLIVLLKGFATAFGTRNKNYPSVLVLEMGADKPGDIQSLVRLAPCNVGVLTAITPVHIEFFKTIKKIAEEKRRIITHLGKDDVAVLNGDMELVREQAAGTKAKVVTYGLKEGAVVRGSDVKIIYEPSGFPAGVNCKVNYEGHIVPIFLPGVIGEQHVLAALAGIAVGSVYGINVVDAAAGLENYAPPPGRMHLVPGIKQTLIIDDSYNASPEAAIVALQSLASIDRSPQATGRRIAMLGDMLQLGPDTEQAHRELGFRVAEAGVDFLITVGEAAKHVAQAAKEAGLTDNQIAKFDDSATAGRFLQEKLETGDVVLIKGSRSMRMEKVVKEIMAEPERANELIVSS